MLKKATSKKSKGSANPAPLTPHELKEIRAYLSRTPEEKAKQEEMHMLYGSAANLPEVQFLDLCNEALTHYELERWRAHPPIALRHAIFKIIFDVVLGNKAEFAKRLSVLLATRRDKKKISKIPSRRLGLKQERGRKVCPYDWIHVVPAAVDLVLGYRVFEIPESDMGLRLYRVTHAELKEAIKRVQEANGFDTSVPISKGVLSSWITRLNIRQFMHDPHQEAD